jgi:hypothetical protein
MVSFQKTLGILWTALNSIQRVSSKYDALPLKPLLGVRSVAKSSRKYRLCNSHQRPNKSEHSNSQLNRLPFSYTARVGFAGGIGGALGTILLFPMDAAKTLRQTGQVKSIWEAVGKLFLRAHNGSVSRAYKGVVMSTLGAM